MRKRGTRDQLTVAQDIIRGGSFSTVKIFTELLDADKLDTDSLDVFAHARPLGISPGYSTYGELAALAIADDKNCRVIQFKYSRSGPERLPLSSLATLHDRVFCRPAGDLFAFDMGTLSMSAYFNFRLRIVNAVDIQSAFPEAGRDPIISMLKIVGKSAHVDVGEAEQRFRELLLPDTIDLTTRAWVSQFLATFGKRSDRLASVPRINTQHVNEDKLTMLAKLSADALRLDIKKPTQATHQVIIRTDPSSQEAQLESMSYSTRVRPDKDVIIKTSVDVGSISIYGSIGWSDGKVTTAKTSQLLEDATVLVTTIGRDDLTNSEAHRASTLLRILQGAYDLLDNPWLQSVWLPGSVIWPNNWMPTLPPPSSITFPDLLPLNASQLTAVNTMLSFSPNHNITMIQGPPGTGKTSVIASYVQLSIAMGRTGIWIVAQSNVAVKNIAEKLIKVGFHGWKLLVSKSFHLDWHEHLYSTLKSHILRSDRFLESAGSELQRIPVILCTISMLSNKHVRSTLTTIVPLNFLVVDEASQIEVGNFVTVFVDFKSTLKKVCFIGDDKQLPPHGQESVNSLQSIFEFPHLTKPEKVIFLNIQYRMPPEIANLISKYIYGGRLKSSESHPIQGSFACKFIDAGGKESKSSNDSYSNKAECQAILKIASKLQRDMKSYCILTPYTEQHNLIEREMKRVQGLAWENKCFTIDSFQGNEDDYIIISIVRTHGVGFLKNLRRTNVMMTRCKKGMFIISSQAFCQGPGVDSLVGKMSKGKGWLHINDIERMPL